MARLRTNLRPKLVNASIILFCVSIVLLSFYQTTDDPLPPAKKYNFNKQFRYPTHFPNFVEVVQPFMNFDEDPSDFIPAPTNLAHSRVKFLKKVSNKDNIIIGLLIVVKSELENHEKRIGIRHTWGESMHYLARTYLKESLPTKVVFLCGHSTKTTNNILKNDKEFEDIIIADFQDTPQNSTLKTLLAMRWAIEEVKRFKYFMLVDDDMLVNTTNVISFLQRIADIPATRVTSELTGVTTLAIVEHADGEKEIDSNSKIPLEGRLLMIGEVVVDGNPVDKNGERLAAEEYPFVHFPPYASGGAILFNSGAVENLYHASFFTKYLPIDDVYLGILAYKMGIIILHSNLIKSSHPGKPWSWVSEDRFEELLAYRVFKSPEQLLQLWTTWDVEIEIKAIKGEYIA